MNEILWVGFLQDEAVEGEPRKYNSTQRHQTRTNFSQDPIPWFVYHGKTYSPSHLSASTNVSHENETTGNRGIFIASYPNRKFIRALHKNDLHPTSMYWKEEG
ncbi:hypothetical protein BC936DRAFT_146075 [Jimgerdemannia flammicorona]|uniref:Uncharacterized protein n=1 Tax=Jimgerdemannia flammicorona TaxID=994334 RepID=A0A433D959_9FUNG|nr:hypothetical protein BC936DRAFT_146075 [Jimgerdemannia flammicorona]